MRLKLWRAYVVWNSWYILILPGSVYIIDIGALIYQIDFGSPLNLNLRSSLKY